MAGFGQYTGADFSGFYNQTQAPVVGQPSFTAAIQAQQTPTFGSGLYGTPAATGMSGAGLDYGNIGSYGNTAGSDYVQPSGGNNTGFGMNTETGSMVLKGLSTIGNLWAANKAQKLAKDHFSFQKGVTETNLANSIKSYNTTLADRAAARYSMEGKSDTERDAYISKNSL